MKKIVLNGNGIGKLPQSIETIIFDGNDEESIDFDYEQYPNIKSAVINDINPDLTLCYQVVRDNPTELIKSLNLIQSD